MTKSKFSYAWLSIPAVLLAWFLLAWFLAWSGEWGELFDRFENQLRLPQSWTVVYSGYEELFPLVDFSGSGIREFRLDNELFKNMYVSLFREVIGFGSALILALVVGAATGFFKPFRQFMYPITALFQSVPPIAWAPIMVLVFTSPFYQSLTASVFSLAVLSVIFIAGFFPMVVTIQEGVLQIQGTDVKAARVLGAKGWQLYRYVYFPASLPFITTGMRLGFSYAWRALVAAEMLGVEFGIGQLILTGDSTGKTPLILLGVAIIGGISFLFEAFIFKRIEAHYSEWSHTNA